MESIKKGFLCFSTAMLVLGAMLLIVSVLAFGNFWPVVKAEPKELPIGVLSLDAGITQGTPVNLGATLAGTLEAASSEAVKWTAYQSGQEAADAMDNKEVYVYLLIPEDFTQKLMAHLMAGAEAPRITVYLNEGMNYTGVTAASKIIDTAISQMKSGVQAQLLAMAAQSAPALPPASVQNILTPFTTDTVRVHPIGNGGSGTMPLMLSVFQWLGSLLSMILIWRATVRRMESRSHAVWAQLIGGLAAITVLSFVSLFTVKNIMGLDINNYWTLFAYALMGGFAFYLLQANVLNWIGMKGWPILIIIWLFGMPAANVPYEFLNSFTKDWVYSWSPFRFTVEAFRDVLYYDNGADLSKMAAVIAISGAVLLGLLILSMLKRSGRKEEDSSPSVHLSVN